MLSLLWNVIRGEKVVLTKKFGCAGCRKTDFAIQYKLLLLLKEHISCLSSDDDGFNIKGRRGGVSTILYENIKSNQKHYCGRVWYVCMLILQPLDTHRKAIDCRSSAVHVIDCPSLVFNYYYFFSKCFNCSKWSKMKKNSNMYSSVC